jgi:hypothetical protein
MDPAFANKIRQLLVSPRTSERVKAELQSKFGAELAQRDADEARNAARVRREQHEQQMIDEMSAAADRGDIQRVVDLDQELFREENQRREEKERAAAIERDRLAYEAEHKVETDFMRSQRERREREHREQLELNGQRAQIPGLILK